MCENELTITGRTGARVGRQAQVIDIPACSVDQKITSEKLTTVDRISFTRFYNEIGET